MGGSTALLFHYNTNGMFFAEKSRYSRYLKLKDIQGAFTVVVGNCYNLITKARGVSWT